MKAGRSFSPASRAVNAIVGLAYVVALACAVAMPPGGSPAARQLRASLAPLAALSAPVRPSSPMLQLVAAYR